MSNPDDSQNEAQFGNTGGFQFVAYTLDVALWGAAMICEERSSGDSPCCKKLTTAKLMATNHIILYAVQNYKDFILLFGNYEAQDVIILEKLFTAISLPLVRRNEDNVLRQSDLDVYAYTFGQHFNINALPWSEFIPSVNSPVHISFVAAGIGQTILVFVIQIMDNYLSLEKLITVLVNISFQSYLLPRSRTGNMRMLFILPSCQLYVISVCGMLMSRESLLEELRSQDGIITSHDMTGAVNEETRRNFTGNSVNGAVHVIPGDREGRTEVNAEKNTSSSTTIEV
ncbi:hypothetical protein B0H19DRAFT_1072138 [Mycena capillaripes]|nr:hypothetical protein B0H19DRAFT_1072138 [Mycena capillaripes]